MASKINNPTNSAIKQLLAERGANCRPSKAGGILALTRQLTHPWTPIQGNGIRKWIEFFRAERQPKKG